MSLRWSVLVSFLIFIPYLSFTQINTARIRDLYRYVEQTDSLAERSTKNFYLEKFLKDGYNYRETWRYLSNGSRIIYFQIDYILDSTEFTEVYYLNRGNLVCSEEYEKINYSMREDELKWGGIFYFESSMPSHVVTLGRRSGYDYRDTNPGLIAQTRFGKRFAELKRHLPMLPREEY
jgi:hypothetical protein